MTMNPNDTQILTDAQMVYILAGATVLVSPIFFRPRIAAVLHRRLMGVADGMQKKMAYQSCSDDATAYELHGMILWFASVMPLIVAGVLVPVNSSQKPDYKLKEFFANNGWAIGYMAALHACIVVARFYAHPWNVRLWLPALVWGLLLKRQDSDGRLTFGISTDDRASSVTNDLKHNRMDADSGKVARA
jgi:hypothetical protein